MAGAWAAGRASAVRDGEKEKASGAECFRTRGGHVDLFWFGRPGSTLHRSAWKQFLICKILSILWLS